MSESVQFGLLLEVACEAAELLMSLESEELLKGGFKGMGVNIAQAKASAKRTHMRKLSKLLVEAGLREKEMNP